MVYLKVFQIFASYLTCLCMYVYHLCMLVMKKYINQLTLLAYISYKPVLGIVLDDNSNDNIVKVRLTLLGCC